MSNLFRPRLPDKKLHPSFQQIRRDAGYAKTMPVIQSWAAGLLDRKGEAEKFIKEFQSTFNSSMWEIYLNRAMIGIGCSVDYSKTSPDFFVRTPQGYEFNIEAVISDQPIGTPKAKAITNADFKLQGALKLIGKIRDKVAIFRGSNGKKHPYSSLAHVKGRPFVIAIAPFDHDSSLTQNNELINMVLFGIGAPKCDGPNLGDQEKVLSLEKESGATVDIGIFTNDSFKEISAVIFSTVGTFGKAVVESKVERIIRSTRYRCIAKDDPRAKTELWQLGTRRFQLDTLNYLVTQRWDFGDHIAGSDVHIQNSSFHRESHLDGFHIYYNPCAEIPFDASDVWPEEVTHSYYDLQSDRPVHLHPDGALVSRQVFEVSPMFLYHLLAGYGFV